MEREREREGERGRERERERGDSPVLFVCTLPGERASGDEGQCTFGLLLVLTKRRTLLPLRDMCVYERERERERRRERERERERERGSHLRAHRSSGDSAHADTATVLSAEGCNAAKSRERERARG
jgi:hypothetical protein